ncbi:hypothetical protein ACRAWC_13980 [Leifsonia sp. L25]|uniref:hypothetical protein n=1 Tax=Actinomycetes TaxID=1760 RepID=UPI003D6827B9
MTTEQTAVAVMEALASVADPADAVFLQRFFTTGPGDDRAPRPRCEGRISGGPSPEVRGPEMMDEWRERFEAHAS